MKRNILIAILLLVIVLPGCSGNKAAELYDTAGFEELQNNKDHAVKLYQEIIRKYPENYYAARAQERLEQLKQK